METINKYLPFLKGYDFTGKTPVIIDFYATWCAPCNALSPLISQLAKEYEGKVKVLKVDVDKNQALASAAGIRSIPTLFFIDINGNIERTSGGMPYEMLAQRQRPDSTITQLYFQIENLLLQKVRKPGSMSAIHLCMVELE